MGSRRTDTHEPCFVAWYLVALVLVLCSHAACSDRSITRDPASKILTLDSSNAIVISSTDTTVLHGVSDATVLSDGSVVVANSGNTEILVFDSTGDLLNSFGRRGAGPGEFAWLSRVFKHSDDSIVVWDDRQRRLSFFDRDGNLGRTVDIGSLADFPSVIGLLGDEFVYRTLVRYVVPRDSVRVTISGSRQPLLTIPNKSNHSVSFDRDGSAVSAPHPLVFTPSALVAVGTGIIATLAADIPEIHLRDAKGALVQTIVLNLPTRDVTQFDREQYIDRRREALLSMRRSTASRHCTG